MMQGLEGGRRLWADSSTPVSRHARIRRFHAHSICATVSIITKNKQTDRLFLMRNLKSISCLLILIHVVFASVLWAGPYPPAADEFGSHAIHREDPAFKYWATGFSDYLVGENVDKTWQVPGNALGKAEGNSFDIVALGSGGSLTLRFDPPIENGEGWDFAVFENSFSDRYLELAYVEVSSNGVDFVRFDAISLTIDPVSGFGNIDPTDVDNLAGKYRQGYGTPFDLEDISDKPGVLSGDVDLSSIAYVRIVDVVGDGSFLDSLERVIYDPYPTFGSAGFDLDAVGVSNGAPYPDGEYVPPSAPPENDDAGFGDDTGCFIMTIQKIASKNYGGLF